MQHPKKNKDLRRDTNYRVPTILFGDNMHRLFRLSNPLTVLLALTFALSACAPTATVTPFLPPTEVIPTQLPTTTPIGSSNALPTFTLAPLASPTLEPTITPTPTPEVCTNNLTYLQDLTVPDGTVVQPGSSVEKKWLVTNSGTCDWDSSYRLKWISGDALGAPTDQALYPARAGTQVTLRIVFTAPSTAGTYQSTWQAFAPDGTAFGDSFYIQFLVGG